MNFVLLAQASGFDRFLEKLYDNLIANGRWKYYLEGLGVTLQITILAALLGIIIGLFVAIVKVSAMNTNNIFLKIGDKICNIYLNVFRGTPMFVQLLMFSLVFFPTGQKLWVAVLAFGMNSGAYVSETFRAGILAVDKGQSEAGRSLGLNTFSTYRYIILPQAIKNILPPLLNEFIALLKETAIVSAVGIADLTKAYEKISARTFEFFIPLLTIAIIYLILVTIMTAIVRAVERRLRQSDNR